MCYHWRMAASLSSQDFLPVGLGLGRAAVRPRYLSVVQPDSRPSFAVAALYAGANSIGKPILKAADPVELEIAIDELLGGEPLSTAINIINEELDGLGGTMDPQLPPIHSVLDEEQSSRFEALAPLYEHWHLFRTKYIELVGPSVATPSLTSETLLDRLYDPAVPPAISALHLDALRGEVALLGLLAAAIWGTSPAPWLAAELLNYITAGIRGSLRLLASVPALAVPESVVPSAERLDLDAVFELNRKAEQGARMLVLMQSPEPDASPRTPWEQLPDEP